MRLIPNRRLDRRLALRLPRPTLASGLELALLCLIAIQCARLVWTAVTPVGPVGDWRPVDMTATAAPPVMGAFDPFFRSAADAPAPAPTTLGLTLHGVRENRGRGGGSAIIALPSGEQSSYAVGEEIVPGATLAWVGADSVRIDRNGTEERLALAEFSGAQTAAGPTPADGDSTPPSINFGDPATLPPGFAQGAPTKTE